MDPVKFNNLLKKLNTDKDALDEIYDEYYPLIVLHLRRRFGKLISAEDTAHDLFVKLLKIHQKDYIEHPISWFYKLADNNAIDEIRKRNEVLPLNELQGAPFNADSMFTRVEVMEYFSHLDKKMQQILYMHFWEGYSLKEIAQILDMNYTTVRVKVFRAYQKFRENK